MLMINLLKKLLRLSQHQATLDLDAPETTILHKEIILSKPVLKQIYINWYNRILKEVGSHEGKKILELGSGGGFLKSIYPSIITSDILPLPDCDQCFSAESIPHENESIDAIVMINVFHHIPHCELFLSEAQRVLKPGGKIVMIEPYNCSWSRFIYGNFHHEPFDVHADWTFVSAGPLSSSNVALPYIVFERDLDLFKSKFTCLSLGKMEFHSPVSYLLSGGVSMKSMIPVFLFSIIEKIESVASSRRFNMFATITLNKTLEKKITYAGS